MTAIIVPGLWAMIIKDYRENSKEKQTFDKDLLQEMDFLLLGDYLASLDEMQEMIASYK